MTPRDLTFLIVALGLAGLALWFYPHCARPSLAFGSAPRFAFTGGLIATAVVVTGGVLLGLDVIAKLVSRDISRWVSLSMIVAWILLSLAFLRPRWFRVFGSPDQTTAPRFLLGWFRREWRQIDTDPPRLQLVQMLEVELEKVRLPANGAYVDEWIQAVERFAHGARLGRTSSDRERLELEARLEGFVPVDIIGRWI